MLGADLPLIADDVTVEHLLAHRSGIGDYVDEDLAEELPLKVPVQRLDSTEAYLPALDGFADEVPGRRAVLLLQQRIRRPGAASPSGRPASRSRELLAERVCARRG